MDLKDLTFEVNEFTSALPWPGTDELLLFGPQGLASLSQSFHLMFVQVEFMLLRSLVLLLVGPTLRRKDADALCWCNRMR